MNRRLETCLLGTALLLLAGCSETAGPALVKDPPPGQSATAAAPATPAAAPTSAAPAEKPAELAKEELPKLADPLPPLDGGRLLVAGPEGWTLPPRDAKWLARFKLQGSNPYPIIYVNPSEDAAGGADTTAATAAEFARQLQAELKQSLEPKGQTVPMVKPLVVGDFAGAQYERQAKTTNAQLERLYLTTVRGGRRYTIEMHAIFGTLSNFRPYALAVAKGMKVEPGEPKE